MQQGCTKRGPMTRGRFRLIMRFNYNADPDRMERWQRELTNRRQYVARPANTRPPLISGSFAASACSECGVPLPRQRSAWGGQLAQPTPRQHRTNGFRGGFGFVTTHCFVCTHSLVPGTCSMPRTSPWTSCSRSATSARRWRSHPDHPHCVKPAHAGYPAYSGLQRGAGITRR